MSDPHLIIRAAHPRDVAALTALANLPGVRHGTVPLPFTTERFMETRLGGPDVHVLVAERDGMILGQAFLSRFVGRRSHGASVGLSVQDDHVGEGIGSRVMMVRLKDAPGFQ